MTELIDLSFIAEEALLKEDVNWKFRTFLKGKDDKKIDNIVAPIADYYTKNIDCTACGNCCKNIMISVDNAEIKKIANALNEDETLCKQKYFDSSTESDMILINAIPCHFLKEKKCTIYQSRPSACSSFPHLDKPHFTSRLFSMLDAYGVCPIVYHTLEDLKAHFNFR